MNKQASSLIRRIAVAVCAAFAVFRTVASELPADATGTHIDVSADVMAIDVSGGALAESYPVQLYSDVDVGAFNCPAYHKDKIALRRIPKGSYSVGYGGSDPIFAASFEHDCYIGLFELTKRQYFLVMGNWPSDESSQKPVLTTNPPGEAIEREPVGHLTYEFVRGTERAEETLSANAVGTILQRLRAKCRLADGRLVGGFDLPTRSQWEVAARSGTTGVEWKYVSGNDRTELGNYAWIHDNADLKLHVAGGKSPNCWGFWDICGNAWEFVRDRSDTRTQANGSDGEVPVKTGSAYLVVGGCMYSGDGASEPEILIANVGSLPYGSCGGQHIGFRLNCLVQEEEIAIEDRLLRDGTFAAIRVGLSESSGAITYNWYRRVNGGGWKPVPREKVSGELYNIDADGQHLNVSLDYQRGLGELANIDSITYKAVLCRDGVEQPTLFAELEMTYRGYIQNGSFETPVIGAEYYQRGGYADRWPFWMNADNLEQVYAYHELLKAKYEDYNKNFNFVHEPSLVWKTTARDGLIEICNADGNQNYTPSGIDGSHSTACYKGHNTSTAGDGVQFVELNAASAGALYQDVLTVPGAKLNWSLVHRARLDPGVHDRPGENDTMYVVIMDSQSALSLDFTTQESINQLVDGGLVVPGATITTVSSDDMDWVKFLGEYKVPQGQYLTRFLFVTGETSSTLDKKGDERTPPNSIGNLIDSVTFSADIPKPDPEHCQATIKVSVMGLPNAQARTVCSNLTVNVTTNNVPFALSGRDQEPVIVSSGFELSWTLTDALPSGGSVAYRARPSSVSVDGYVYDVTLRTEKNGSEIQEGEDTLSLGSEELGCITLVLEFERYVKNLWITDHADAGSEKVHLAFQPIFARPVDMESWISCARENGWVRYVAADTEAELVNAPMMDDFTFRGGDGMQDVEKGWCWITVPATHKFYKIVICSNDQLDGVQLWEGGPIFASCNIGATRPEEYGYYFWWGDTVGYTHDGNQWNPVFGGMTPFSFSGSTSAILTFKMLLSELTEMGYIDDNSDDNSNPVLNANHDAARAHRDAPWRMMTQEELQNLTDTSRCTSEWTNDYNGTGVKGRIVTGAQSPFKNNKVFFPAAGRGDETRFGNDGIKGRYWCATPKCDVDKDKNTSAYCLDFASDTFVCNPNNRYLGFTVRPVRDAAE